MSKDESKKQDSFNGHQTSTSINISDRTQCFDMESDTVKVQMDQASETPSMLLVLVGPEDLIGASFSIENAISVLGRSGRLSQIFVKHPSISKTHFQLSKDGDQTLICDLKSTNKTFVNDVELEPYKKITLEHNDQIRAGNIIFKFLKEGALEAMSATRMINKAQTDSLTGLANRHALKEKGQSYFLTSKVFALVLFDVDNFKAINDTYGHLAGDFVLKELAKAVMELVREGDMVFRYGGDEFCIFTRNTVFVAKNISERIRKTIEEKDFTYEGKKIDVSVSVGFSNSVKGDATWRDVYQRADKAFYQAKNEGRNRVKFL